MNEILHANIFFIIASVATVIFCILVCFILYQVYKIVKSVRVIVSRIEAESEQIAADISVVRDFVRQGSVIRTIFNFFNVMRTSRKRQKYEDD